MSLVEKMLLLGVQKRMTIIRTPVGNSRLVRLPFQQAEFNFRTAPINLKPGFTFLAMLLRINISAYAEI